MKLLGKFQYKICRYRVDKMLEKADKMNFQANAYIKNGNWQEAKVLIQEANELRRKCNVSIWQID